MKKQLVKNARSIQRHCPRKRSGIIFQTQGYKKLLEVENTLLRKTSLRQEKLQILVNLCHILPSTSCWEMGTLRPGVRGPRALEVGEDSSESCLTQHIILETYPGFQRSARFGGGGGGGEPPKRSEIYGWSRSP